MYGIVVVGQGILVRSSLWLAGHVPDGCGSHYWSNVLCVILSVCIIISVSIYALVMVCCLLSCYIFSQYKVILFTRFTDTCAGRQFT